MTTIGRARLYLFIGVLFLVQGIAQIMLHADGLARWIEIGMSSSGSVAESVPGMVAGSSFRGMMGILMAMGGVCWIAAWVRVRRATAGR